jgi:hypothetical protein
MKTCCETESCCQAEAAKSECSSSPAQCLDEIGGGCLLEGATQMWAKSFSQAMCQAQTEILKTKILKAWGPMMEQAADAMMETMGVLWQEKIAELRVAQSKEAFKERLQQLWLQGGKK